MSESDRSVSADQRLKPIIDAALHRYFSRVVRRYIPVLVALVVLAGVLMGLPSRPKTESVATAGGAAPGSLSTGPSTTIQGSTSAAGTEGTAATASTASTASTAPTASAADGDATPVSDGGTSEPQPGQPGIAASGVDCAASERQVTWTPYAPPCVPTFAGDNGGATYPGVTGDMITVVMRTTNDWEANAQSSGAPTFEERVADTEVFIDFFNKNFELYGREVELKSFVGRGRQIDEFSGGGQAGAQSDAQTARDMGGFAVLGGFAPFQAAVAERGMIGIGTPYAPTTYFEEYAPHLYADPRWYTGRDFGQSTAATVCERMAGLPAAFASDGATQSTKRVFGMTTIDDPSYAEGGKTFETAVAQRCNVRLAERMSYAPGPEKAATQAFQIVAKMKAAGVTTLVHAGDPLMFAQLTLAADSQGWYPEYVGVDPTASVARLGSQRQMSSAFIITPFGAAPGHSAESEPGRVFRMASGGTAPQSAGVDFPGDYMYVLQLFMGLQAAGPDLNPHSFNAGVRSIPDSTGEFGLWRPAQGYTMPADFVVARWARDAHNAGDGERGDFLACDGGTRYPLNPQSMGSGQLDC